MFHLLNHKTKSITFAAAIIGAASLASRILGFLRDRILAGKFGAGDELDIYFAAFRLPDLIYNLLIVGALSAGFIPIFSGYFLKSKKEAWELVANILNITLFGALALAIIFILFSPFIIPLITPGFSGQKLTQTVSLTRLLFLSPLFLAASAVFGGVLQSFRQFLIYSFAPIFYNLGIIFGALVLTKFWGIYGLGLGVILGAFLHMAIQIPTLLKNGFRYRFIFNFSEPGLIKILKLAPPRTFGLIITQLNFLALTVIASKLAAGSISVFNLAYNIFGFPLGIIGASFAVAAFPAFSELAEKRDFSELSRVFSSTLRQILFFIIPLSALFLVLRAQIVRVILGSGKFDWTDTILTIQTFQYLILALFAEALILLLIRIFFSFQDTKTPFFLGLISSLIRIPLAWWLSLYLGVAGLALGFSVGGIIYFILLWFFLQKIIAPDSKKIFRAALKIIIASLFGGIGSWLALRVMLNFVTIQTGIGIFFQGAISGALGIFIYVIVQILLKSEEMKNIFSSIKRRLPLKQIILKEEIIE